MHSTTIRSLIQLIWVETKLFLREPFAFFLTLIFPLILLVIFGVIFGNRPAYPGYRVVDIYVPALLSMVIAYIALMGIPIVISEYKEMGVLRRFRTTPLSTHRFLIAQIWVQFMMVLVALGLVVLLGKTVFQIRFGGSLFYLTLALILSCAAFFSVGFAVSGLVSSSRTAQATGATLFFPMLFLSGSAIPREMFPEVMKQISNFIPMTHMVELLTNLWMGKNLSNQLVSISVLIGLIVLAVPLAIKTFRWD